MTSSTGNPQGQPQVVRALGEISPIGVISGASIQTQLRRVLPHHRDL